MGEYKVGDVVISRYKSSGCAPEGQSCRVIRIVPPYRSTSKHTLYEVKTRDGKVFRNYDDELDSIDCDYCQKGSQFQWFPVTATIAVYNYIFGNELRTVIDFSTHDQTNIKRITHCPFCGTEVHDLPDEEMEEIEEEE